jgi:hypothetical protein
MIEYLCLTSYPIHCDNLLFSIPSVINIWLAASLKLGIIIGQIIIEVQFIAENDYYNLVFCPVAIHLTMKS